jgi:hypothetical protein
MDFFTQPLKIAFCFSCCLLGAVNLTHAQLVVQINGGTPNVAICAGQSVMLTAVASGGLEPYIYEWSNGGTDPSITVSVGGVYEVTVTDDNGGGSTVMDNILVIENALPIPTIFGPLSACVGSTGNIYSTDPGNTNYIWNIIGGSITSGGGPGDASAIVTWTVTGPQSISVSYTDGNGCTAAMPTVSNVQVNDLPVVSAGSYGPFCIDASPVALSGTPGGGTWTGIGVAGTSFDPSAGTQTLTYTYTDGNGCTNSGQTTITVHPLPIVSAGSYGPVCIDASPVALSGSPAGGIWTGIGVAGNSFDPSAGTQTLTYTYTDGNGCTNSDQTTIVVNPLPTVSAGSYGPGCSNDGNIALSGTPAGGTWTGIGVTGSSFDPSAGTQTLTYTYTDPSGCTNSDQTTITVHPLPIVSAGSYGPFCVDAPLVALSGTPGGGTWTGIGVTGDSFDPSVGTQTLTYTYTDGNGCTNSNQTTITVHPLPIVSAGSYGPFCVDAPLVALSGTPGGGTWTGIGVSGTSFDPSAGTQTLTYIYTDGNGCTNSDQTTIVVNPLPTVSAGSYGPLCSNDGNITLSGMPAGGTWTGIGVAGTSFDPSVGTQTLTYTYTDGNGCTNSDQTTITVNPPPAVSAGSYGPVCIDASPVTLSGMPAGGTWTGIGVAGTSFDPSASTQTLTYTYTDGNGCTNSGQTTITVHPLPIVSAGSYGPVCIDASPVALSGSPAGGIWTGIGVAGNSFDPSAGTQTLTYTYTDGNGCTNSDQTTIVVNPLPTVSAGSYGPLCSNDGNITLSGMPAGGTWTGIGVAGTSFDPSVGTQTLTYTYTDGNGCTNSDQTTITVNPPPAVSAGSYGPFCVDAPLVALSGTPGGGTWTGIGVTGDSFDPSVGTQTLTYTYTDGNGCTNSGQTTITVHPLPIVSAGSYGPVCIDASPVALSGSPAGGIWTGIGVAGNSFDPSAGTQTLTYTYTDGNGCTNSDQTTIVVNPLPTVSAGSYGPGCSNDGNIALSGTPAGGTWTGIGVTGSSFDPSAGTQTLTYTYTDPSGCTNSDQTTITVHPLPIVSAGSYGPVCIDASPVALSGSPAGGIWTGIGVTGDSFDPSVGTQTLTYTYTDGNGCTNSDQTTITVHPLPAVSAGSYGPVCIDASPVALSGSPAGGIWTGIGVAGNSFDPSAGTQTLTYTYTDGNGCTNSDQTTILVNPLPTPTASSNSPQCSGSTLILSASGGTIYSWSGPNGFTSSQQNPSIPNVTVAANGNYTVVVTDANNCSASTVIPVEITPQPSATISYPGLPYCNNDATPRPVTLTGTAAYTGGTFSAPAGLIIDGNTGAITPQGSTGGTYTVTYTIPASGGCPEIPVTTSVTITPLPTAVLSYPATEFCTNNGALQPLTITGTGAYTGGAYAASPPGLNFDVMNGAIVPSSSSPGTYTITYTIPASGNCPAVPVTTQVTITALPVISTFNYAQPFCNTVMTPQSPTLAGTGAFSGGTFSASGGLIIDPATGAINPSANASGTYTITYTTIGGGGCPPVTANTSVTITALPAATIAYAGTPYCSDGGTATVTRTGNAGGTYSSTAGLQINSGTGAINLGLSTPGTYTVTYTIAAAGGCPAVTATAPITITQLPNPIISYPGANLCPNSGIVSVNLSGFTGPGGTFSATPAGLSIDPATGAINTATGMTTPGTYAVTYTIPTSSGCPQVTRTVNVAVNDVTPPVLTVPATANVQCSAGILPAVTGQATATDNCPGTVNVTYTDSNPVFGNCPNRYTLTRTWTATDANGNTSTGNQVINVDDTTPPTISCPPNITVANPSAIPVPDTTQVIAMDACGPVTRTLVSETYTGLDQAPGFCPTSVIRTYRATDACGNSSTCVQTITVASTAGCGPCQAQVNFHPVDLSNSPSASLTLLDISRNGLCCDATNPRRCVAFNVILHPDAVGVIIQVSNPSPPGQLWRVNCMDLPISNGNLCLPGGFLYTFTYCMPNPGGNDFTFTSIPGLSTSNVVNTRLNCDDNTITVSGEIVPSSIVFTDLTGGGQYLSYLSPSSGSANVTFTPDANAPSVIQYRVCGQLINNACQSGVDCDTITVNVYPPIAITVAVPPLLCSPNNQPVQATVTPIGQTYNLVWYNGPGGTGSVVQTGGTQFTPATAGTYSVVVTDVSSGWPCSTASADFTVAFDVTPPAVTPPAIPLQLECNAPGNAGLITTWLAGALALDNGNPVPVSNNYTAVPQSCGLMQTVTFTATDVCGNAGTAMANINFVDTDAPSITCPQVQTVNCAADVPPHVNSYAEFVAIGGAASDLCDGNLAITWASDVVSDSICPNVYTLTRTYRATDACGNTETCAQVINVNNNTAPVVPANPPSVTVQCLSAATPPTPPTVSDACGNPITPTMTPSADPACEGSKTYTFTYTNCAGSSASWVYTYIIDRTSAPTIQPAATMANVSCPDATDAPPALPVVTDVCGNVLSPVGPPIISPKPACEGTRTYTYTYTDCSLLSTQWVFTYTVDHSGGLTAPANGTATVSCPALAINPGSPANITDACGTTVNAVLVGQDDPTPACEGTVVWRYRYTACDMTTTVDWVFIYTIDRTTAPAEVGGPVATSNTVECLSAAIPPVTLPVIQDVCGNVLPAPAPVVTDSPNPLTCEGTRTYTYTYTDCSGLDFVWTYTYTIDRTTAPVQVGGPAPTSSTVQCVSDAVVPATLPVVQDLCGNVIPAPDPVITDNPSPLTCEGTRTYTYTYTDCAGLSFEWSYTYQIIVPEVVFDTRQDTTISCSAAPPVGTPLGYSNGASGSCLISGNVTGTISGTHNECGGSYMETWTFTDACNRTITHSRTITVAPAPQAAFATPLPNNISISCSAAPPVGTSLSYTNGEAGTCAISGSVTGEISGDPHTACGGSYTETWTFTDACNRTITHSRTISVDPAPAAAFVTPLPGNITINCADAPPTGASLSYTNDGTGVCEISGSVTGTISGSHTECGGSYIETWTFTDACNRMIAHSRTITVNPAPAAVFAAVSDITIDCNAAPPVGTSLSYTNGETGTCAINGSVTGTISGTYDECGGSYTESWSFLDACGRTINASRTITVSPAPVAAFAAVSDITIDCNAAPPVGTSLSYTNGEIGTCAISGSVTGTISGTHNECGGSYTESWTFTDDCDRSITASRVITVSPAAPAVFASVDDITITCAEAESLTGSALSYTNGASGGCLISGSVTGTLSGSHTECGGSYTESWSFTDACGRTITASRVITVQPAPVAVFEATDDISITCQEAATLTGSGLAYSNGEAGACLIAGTVTGTLDGSYDECGGSFTEAWTFIDACGRTIEASRTITVEPAPEAAFDPADDITITCEEAASLAGSELAYSNGEAGACLIAGTVTGTLDGAYGECGGSFTESWSFTDACGRTITASRIITVQPAPEASFDPADDITITCEEAASLAGSELAYSNGEAGACLIAGTVTGTLDGAYGECGGSFTESWSFTDACGRTITASRVITVQPAPVAVFDPADDITITCEEAASLAGSELAYSNGEAGACLIAGTVTGTLDGSYDECGGSFTEAWTFIDACGRTIEASRTITVEPAPEAAFEPADDITITCEEAATLTGSELAYSNGEAGACLIAGTVTGTLDGSYGECGGSFTESWAFTDECGREITASRIITVEPAPEAAFEPADDITITCEEAATLAGSELAYSNGEAGACLIAGTVTGTLDGSYDECGGSFTESWSFTDACGRTITASRIITVEPAPEAAFEPADDITITCEEAASLAGSELAYSNGEAGACLIAGTVTGTLDGSYDECGGSFTESWSFTDACGRTITASRIITVQPAPEASFDPADDITITCEEAASLAGSELAYSNGEAGACLIAGTVTGTLDGSYDECGGSFTEAWTFIDACGRTIEASRTITVEPAPEAAFEPADDITITCEEAATLTGSELAYSNGEAGACLIAGTVTGTLDGSYDECGGSFTESWAFTDECGREITASRIITVQPAPEATFDPADDISITCQEAATLTGSELAYSNGEAGACLIAGTVTGTLDGSYDECGGSFTESWSFTDACGRTITASRIITVEPAPEAAFEPADDITITCEEAATLTGSELAYSNGEAGACLIAGMVTGTLDGSYDECGGSFTESWAFTDECGREITASRIITVEPAPEAAFEPANDITITCQEAATLTGSELAYSNGEAGACLIAGTVTGTLDGAYGECGGSFTESWSFTDACGRTITASRVITVQPAPVAVFDPADDITITCEEAASLAGSELAYSNGEAGACLIAGTVTGTLDGSYDECGGSFTEAWTFIDACGRTIEASRTITVEPAPEAAFEPADDITITCEEAASLAGSGLAYSNGEAGACLIAGTVTGTLDGSYDECGGSFTESWSFTDACGRTITASRVITVQPAPVAVFEAADDISITCQEAATLTGSELAYSNGEAGACLIAGTVTGTLDGSYGECGGSFTESWAFTDECGREITASRIITVEPAPEAAFEPADDITITCEEAASLAGSELAYSNGEAGACLIAGTVTGTLDGSYDECGGSFTESWSFTDACGRTITASRIITVEPAPEAAFEPADDITITCEEAASLAGSELAYSNGEAGACLIAGTVTGTLDGSYGECGGSFTEAWTFIDACGRTIEASRTITVEPAPEAAFEPADDITITCEEAATLTGSELAYSNGEAGACLIAGTVTGTLDGSYGECGGSFTESWAFNRQELAPAARSGLRTGRMAKRVRRQLHRKLGLHR